MKSLPTGPKAYDYAYNEAMKRIAGYDSDSEKLAKQALSWISYAQRPLTASELQHALAVEEGDSELDEENLPRVEDMVSVCAGLVTVDDESGIIRLVHYTTQEYFERTQDRWFPNAEADITTICVTYLSFNIFDNGFCRTDNEFEERLRLNCLYDYAAHNWGHHARRAAAEPNPTVKNFLKSETKVEASSQALLVAKTWYRHSRYSQQAPRQLIGLHLAAYFGVENAARFLFDTTDPNTEDSYCRTPLSYAAENGHEAVVKLLQSMP